MVKPGYKQTEIGVVPKEWSVMTLRDIADFLGGGTPSKSIAEYWNGDIPWISSSDISLNSVHGLNITRYITGQAVKESSTQLCPRNAILIVTRVGVGKIAIAPTNICTSQDFTNIVLRQDNVEYVARALQPVFYCMSNETQGTSIKGVTTDEVKNTSIALPPIKEQEQIATVLSEIDELISLTEKQISKKKAIKQGAMQELLTGKRRLPGFSGEWRYFNLMKNSKVKARIGWQGLKKSEYLDSGYALLVTGTDFDDGRVLWDGCHYVTRSRYEQDRNIQLQNNDILITKDGSLGKAALVQGLTKPATLNSGIFVIRPLQDAYDPVFVYQILSSFVFKNFLDRLSAGSTIIHLYQKDVGKFEFLLPPTIAEQKAIAEALSEMDSDIAALENKLTKYRQVKQGMMQQLLTGKIRLM